MTHEMKMVLIPEWLATAMAENAMGLELARDVEKLSSILSKADLSLFVGMNHYAFHELCERLFGGKGFTGVRPCFVDLPFEDRPTDSSSLDELSSIVYSPKLETYHDLIAHLLHPQNTDAGYVKLVAELVLDDTVFCVTRPDRESKFKEDSFRKSLESILECVNNNSPIVMERTAFFKLYASAPR